MLAGILVKIVNVLSRTSNNNLGLSGGLIFLRQRRRNSGLNRRTHFSIEKEISIDTVQIALFSSVTHEIDTLTN